MKNEVAVSVNEVRVMGLEKPLTEEDILRGFQTDGIEYADSLLKNIRVAVEEQERNIDPDSEDGLKQLYQLSRSISSAKTPIANAVSAPLKKAKAEFKAMIESSENALKYFQAEMDAMRDKVKEPYEKEKARIKALEDEAKAIISELDSFKLLANPVTGQMVSSGELKSRIGRINEISLCKFEVLQADIYKKIEEVRGLIEVNISVAEQMEKVAQEAEEAKRQAEEARQQAEIQLAVSQSNVQMQVELSEAKKTVERARQDAMRELEEQKQEEEAKRNAERQKVELDDDNTRRVNNNVVNSLCELGCTKPVAIAIIEAILNGEIVNLSIDYTK